VQTGTDSGSQPPPFAGKSIFAAGDEPANISPHELHSSHLLSMTLLFHEPPHGLVMRRPSSSNRCWKSESCWGYAEGPVALQTVPGSAAALEYRPPRLQKPPRSDRTVASRSSRAPETISAAADASAPAGPPQSRRWCSPPHGLPPRSPDAGPVNGLATTSSLKAQILDRSAPRPTMITSMSSRVLRYRIHARSPPRACL